MEKREAMQCRNCGNDLDMNKKFCGKCGAKIPEITGGDMRSSDALSVNQMSKGNIKDINIKNKLPIIIGIIAGIAALIIVITVIKGIATGIYGTGTGISGEANKSFSPVGVWKSSDVPITLKFQKNGELKIGAFGIFKGGLHWENMEYDTYFISGEIPEIAGTDLGEIGGYAYYDREEKTLSIVINEDYSLTFEKISR